MYKYDNVAFRVIEKSDLEILKNLHNDQDTYLNLFNIDFIDEEDQLEWWKNLHKKKNDRRYVLCFADNPKEIFGRLKIQNINSVHCNCEIGLDIIPVYRKQGLATKSYHMVLDFLFNHQNMHMVYLRVGDFNPEAKKVYEKAGFVQTGLIPEFFYRHGKYWDYIIMSITKCQYQNGDSQL